MIPELKSDSFNPNIYYVSEENYNISNSLSCHFHPFCVIMYTLDISGSGWYRVEGNLFPITRGTMVICNPAVYHEKILAPDSKTCEYHIAFDNLNISGLPANCILGPSSYSIINAGALMERIECDFAEILEEQDDSLFGYYTVVRATAIKLIALTLRLIVSDSAAPVPRFDCNGLEELFPSRSKADKLRIVESVRKHLMENYYRNISIGDLAETLHISHVYLSRIFRQVLDDTPVSYLAKLRLDMARELLESGEYTVRAAAKRVGYEDSAYFSRIFKKHFGFNPAKCRG